MNDTYAGLYTPQNYPAFQSAAVTPSDSADLATTARMIYVGGTGNISMTLLNDTSPVTFNSLPVGWYPFRAKRIYATGTTATNIVALW